MPEVADDDEKDDRPKNISRFFPRNRMPTAYEEQAPTRCCLGDSQGPDLDIDDFVRHVGCGTGARPSSPENAEATRIVAEVTLPMPQQRVASREALPPRGLPTPSVGPPPAVPSASPPQEVATDLSTGCVQALALPPGYRLHEYRIERMLGQGGFGITYLATDINLTAPVAIKEYLPESIAFRACGQTVSVQRPHLQGLYRIGLDAFLVEARTLATFRHPNIVRVARFFEANQTAYMVLEYERGSPLKAWWPKNMEMSERELTLLIQPLLDGLAVVHRAGFLHRDIKPDNILVRRAGGALVLLDFGSARGGMAGGRVRAGVAVTPGYAPIEQYFEDQASQTVKPGERPSSDYQQGPWTDIYAMGATLYWMITGRKPPDAEARLRDPDPFAPVSHAVLPAHETFSPQFLSAIDWALQRRPKDRPRNLHEWQRHLFAANAASLTLQQALQHDDEPVGIDIALWTLLKRPRLLWNRMLLVLPSMRKPSCWPLALKMTLAMIVTALMPMLITANYNLHFNLQAMSSAELRHVELLARSTAGRVEQLIGDSRNLARSLARYGPLVDFLSRPIDEGARRAMIAKLVVLAGANPDIHLIMLIDAAGNAVATNDPQVTGHNIAFREYFREAIQGRSYITGIVVGAVSGTAAMFYAHPAFDAAGRVIGAVVLSIRASALQAILDEVNAADGKLKPFMIDGDGVVIFHPDPKVLYSSLAPLSPQALTAIRADQRFRRDDIESLGMPDLAQALVGARMQGHISYYSTVSKQEEIAGYAPVPGHHLVVGVAEPQAVFEEPLDRLHRRTIASVALIGLLFLGLALSFARSIVDPIRALTKAAHSLKQGDYAGATVRVTSRDEIGRLGRTFNVLIDVLREREREHR
jgi:serine/threonine protein kinase/HAMP domain-containing protein